MTSGAARPRRWCTVLACILPSLAAAGPALDPAQLRWSGVELAASKLFISAATTIALAERPRRWPWTTVSARAALIHESG